MKKKYAPIIVFTYKRSVHLKKLINSLKNNKLSKKSNLIIFSDGPKNNNNLEIESIEKVRYFLKKISGFKSIKIYQRSTNYGLSKNIINGLDTVFKKFPYAIILEDDLVVDSFFLEYMNEGLNIFKNNASVASVHGYTYPIKFKKKISNYYFIKGADCWGWATWKRAWKIFESDGNKLKKIIDTKKQKKEFNFNNSFNYYDMLVSQIKKKNNSWAIRWYASAFVRDMLTLYPNISHVKNIGMDHTGTHGAGFKKNYTSKLARKKYTKIDQMMPIKENLDAKRQMIKYFKSSSDIYLIKILKKIYYLFR